MCSIEINIYIHFRNLYDHLISQANNCFDLFLIVNISLVENQRQLEIQFKMHSKICEAIKIFFEIFI